MYSVPGGDSVQGLLMRLAQIAADLESADMYRAEDLMIERAQLLKQLRALQGKGSP
jgi:hypothetical protein